MNILLLTAADVVAPGRAHVEGRRATHVQKVLGKGTGDTVRVGLVDDGVGTGTVIATGGTSIEILYNLTEAPPVPSPVVLALALPRPPMLRRVLQTVATFGVKEIHLFHAKRVEKSFWDSSALDRADLREQLLLGLEQGRDTGMPVVHEHPRFRPFAEDVLPGLAGAGQLLLAEERGEAPVPTGVTARTVIVVGPEGGLVPFEHELLRGVGAQAVTLGPRPHRVEVAVAALLGRMA